MNNLEHEINRQEVRFVCFLQTLRAGFDLANSTRRRCIIISVSYLGVGKNSGGGVFSYLDGVFFSYLGVGRNSGGGVFSYLDGVFSYLGVGRRNVADSLYTTVFSIHGKGRRSDSRRYYASVFFNSV